MPGMNANTPAQGVEALVADSGPDDGRRKFLGQCAAGVGLAVAGGISGAPWVHAREKPELRYITSGVTAFPEIASRAEQELGIRIVYQVMPSDDILKMVVTRPNDLDILELDYALLKQVYRLGRMQTIPASAIRHSAQIATVLTSGRIDGHELSPQGGAPFTLTFADGADSKTFSASPSDWMTVVPIVYNADTLGVRPDLVDRPITRWSELLNPEFKGRTALIDVPSIGIIDAALAIESMGRHRYSDKGNMSRDEIDLTVDTLIEAKRAGQFHGLWSDFNQSVDFMASGKVVIQSMWSPAVTRVRQMGIACSYPPLQEGYRGWCYGLGLSKTLQGSRRSAALEFIDWFLSGWPGAFLQRQGYYPSVLDTARAHLTADEWGYWIEGKAAAEPITGPDGSVLEPAGTVRDGGSYTERMSSIACWNSIMDQSRHLIRQWKRFQQA